MSLSHALGCIDRCPSLNTIALSLLLTLVVVGPLHLESKCLKTLALRNSIPPKGCWKHSRGGGAYFVVPNGNEQISTTPLQVLESALWEAPKSLEQVPRNMFGMHT